MAQANPTGDATEVIIQVDAAEAAERTAPGCKQSLGRPALLAFVAVSVALIVMIWVDNLTVDTNTTPGYYHGEFLINEGHYATVTAEAVQFELTLTAAPAPQSTPEPQSTPVP